MMVCYYYEQVKKRYNCTAGVEIDHFNTFWPIMITEYDINLIFWRLIHS